MRLALLVGANPRKLQECAIVRVESGKWRVVSDAEDSTFLLASHPRQAAEEIAYIYNGVIVDGDRDVKLCIGNRGGEAHVSIFLEKVG